MKKLISLLMILLLALTGMAALAEEPANTPEVPTVTESDATTELVATTEPGNTTAPEAREPSLIAKGLTVTGFGLAGVFLVLILFFLMIKIMGKMLK